MAAKPTQDPKWVTSDDPLHIIEPTAPQKLNGIVSGSIWGREHLNWMFNSISKWIDWVRSYAMDKDNNLSDVTNTTTAFSNIKQAATTSATGVVKLSAAGDIAANTAGVIPDAAQVYTFARDGANIEAGTISENRLPWSTESIHGTVREATAAEMTAGSSTRLPTCKRVKDFTSNADNLTSGTVNTARLPAATTAAQGAVEKATVAELEAGTADVYPDAATVQEVMGTTEFKPYAFEAIGSKAISSVSFSSITSLVMVTLSNDGLKGILIDGTTKNFRTFTLSTAHDLSTYSYTGVFSFSGDLGGSEVVHGGSALGDGSTIFICTNEYVRAYTMSTDWDADTAASGLTLDIAQSSAPQDCYVKQDGNNDYLTYILTSSTVDVYTNAQWSLVSPIPSGGIVTHNISFARDLWMSEDGLTAQIYSITAFLLHEFYLVSPWSTSAAAIGYNHKTTPVYNEVVGSGNGIAFTLDGSFMLPYKASTATVATTTARLAVAKG